MIHKEQKTRKRIMIFWRENSKNDWKLKIQTLPSLIKSNLTFLLEPYFPNDYLLSSLRSQIKNWKSFLKCFSDSKFFFKAIIVRQKKVFPFQFFRMFKCFEARVVVVGHCTNDLLQNLLRPQPHLCQLVVCYRVTKIRKNG